MVHGKLTRLESQSSVRRPKQVASLTGVCHCLRLRHFGQERKRDSPIKVSDNSVGESLVALPVAQGLEGRKNYGRARFRLGFLRQREGRQRHGKIGSAWQYPRPHSGLVNVEEVNEVTGGERQQNWIGHGTDLNLDTQ